MIKAKWKPYKCKVCSNTYEKWSSEIRSWCSPECGSALAMKNLKRQKEKERRVKNRKVAEEKEQLKTIAKHAEELRKILQWIARELDKDLPCISTGEHHRDNDGGHCYGVKAYPGLQFWMHNIHKQSVYANRNLGGDGAGYILGLKERYGQEYVDSLQEMAIKYQNLKPSKEELIEWKKKARQLKRDIEKGTPHNRDSINKALSIYI